SRSVLVVHNAGRLFKHARAERMAGHLCPQSHGRCDRRVPLGASRKSTSRPDVARVCIGDGLSTDRWSSLLPAYGTEPCRYRLMMEDGGVAAVKRSSGRAVLARQHVKAMNE